MDRREKLLSGIDLARATGVEIGPLNNPIVTRQDGEILYVDHADTATLRTKYQDDPNVDVPRIVEVDAVWGSQTLQEAIGPERKVDYILASHVIEHVPDLITWLDELHSVLKSGGEVRLAVPDRRFTFDYLRRETQLADVINAYLVRARKPLPIAILDCLINFTTVNNVEAWTGKLDPAHLTPTRTLTEAISAARDALDHGSYHDVHCWVFTPKSFAELFADATDAGLIRFACSGFYDTPQYHIEFIVRLRQCDDRTEAAESWRRMARAVDVTNPELRGSAELPSEAARTAELLGEIRQQLDRIEQASAAGQATLLAQLTDRVDHEAQHRAALDRLQLELDAVHASTSWKLTGPLRAVAKAARSRRPG